MKKSLRLQALLIALVLLISCLGMAACGGSTTDTQTTDTTTDTPAADTAAPETEEPTEEPADTGISYPLVEETYEVTWWLSFMSQFSQSISGMADYAAIQYAEDLTNIHINWQEVSYSAANDQRNIIIASEDYPDIMPLSAYYTGGQTAAIADGVIYDLAPLMEENAPDMLSYYTSTDEIRRNFYNSDGSAAGLFTVRDEVGQTTNSALAVRGDWLDELGMDVPTTYDELTAYMEACRDKYGADSALLMDSSMLFTQGISAGYDTKGYISSGRSFYQIDGVVDCGIASDSTKEFMEWYAQIYADGLVCRDWMSVSEAPGETDRWSYVFNGQSCVFMVAANQVSLMEESGRIDNPDFYVQAIPYLAKEKGGSTHMADGSTFGMGGYTNITTACDNPELVLRWFNYWWTDDGIMTANLGVQGDSWDYDEDGNWYYTDALLNNEWGVDPSTAIYAFTVSDFVLTYYMGEKLTALYSDQTMELLDTWGSNADTAYNMPTNLEVLEEDKADYSNYISELETYAVQKLGAFLTGAEDIETGWDEYVETCSKMGYDYCIEAWQKALDDYLSR